MLTSAELPCRKAALNDRKRGPAGQTDSGSTESQAARPVTLGVLLDAKVQERWVLESLQQVLTVPGARLAAVAVAGGSRHASLAAYLHRLLDGLDKQLRCRNERLFDPVAIPARLEAPFIEITLVRDGGGWRPDAPGIGALRLCNVDIW